MEYQIQIVHFPKNAKINKHEFTTYDPTLSFNVESNFK